MMQEEGYQQPTQLPENQSGIATDAVSGRTIETAEQMRILLDHTPDLITFADFLKGRYYDAISRTMKEGKPLCNERGYARIMQELTLRSSTIYGVSKLTEDEIRLIMKPYMKSLAKELWVQRKPYGIDMACYRTMINTIHDTCYCVIKNSQDGTMQEIFKGTTRSTEIRAIGSARMKDLTKGMLK